MTPYKIGFTLPMAALLMLASTSIAQERVPAERWMRYATPEEAGWSTEGVEEARAFADSIGSAAFMLIHDGAVVAAYGDYARRYMSHSVRKSLLSGLYGPYVAEGAIDTTRTLADLNITDRLPLSEMEARARVSDLLKARSGVYHPAAYETAAMAASRPERGSHEPGTFWYYNNWDFNVLATIFRQETGDDVFEAFSERIAAPIGMEDYRVHDGYYHLEPEHSNHPAYPLRMSTRDLARFGLLFEREGRWGDEQVIPASWVGASTRSYSDVGQPGLEGYGYLWWVLGGDLGEQGGYAARGVGLQAVIVVPGLDLVFVHRVDTYRGDRVGSDAILGLLDRLIEARNGEGDPNPELVVLDDPSPGSGIARLPADVREDYTGTYTFPSGHAIEIVHRDGQLLIHSDRFGTFGLIPLSQRQFLVEDARETVFFVPVSGRDSVALVEERTLVLEAAFLSDRGRTRDALEMLERAVEFYPASSGTRRRYADALLAIGDTLAARAGYQRALELAPDDIESELGLGRTNTDAYATPTPQQLRAYVGTYRGREGGLNLEFSEQDGRLFILGPGQPRPLPLVALPDDRFFFTDRNIEVTFIRDDEKRVKGMEARSRDRGVRLFDRIDDGSDVRR